MKLVSSTGFAVSISVENSPVEDVEISGITLDGQNKPFSVSGRPGLIRARTANRLKISNCFFMNSSQAGIDLELAAGIISANEFWNNKVALNSVSGTGLIISNNYIRDSRDNGIIVSRGTKGFDGTIVKSNRIYTVNNETGGSGQFGNAIMLYRLDSVIVTENVISSANYSGIRANACSNVAITGTQILYNRECAIFVENPWVAAGVPYQGIVVTNNSIFDSGEGIKINNPEIKNIRTSVIGNTIQNVNTKTFSEWSSPDRNPSNQYTRITNACGIINSSDAAMTGNTIEDCSVAGIVIHLAGTWNPATQSRPDQKTVVASVIGNTVRNSAIGIGYNDADNRGYAEIAGNGIFGATNGSITCVHVTDLSGGGLPSGNGLVHTSGTQALLILAIPPQLSAIAFRFPGTRSFLYQYS